MQNTSELAGILDGGFHPGASYDPTLCSRCGSGDYSTVVLGPTIPIIKCSSCGLMRQGWVSESIKHSRIFVDYAGGEERFKKQKAEKEAAQQGDFLKIADALQTFLPDKGKILEIGCAMGTTLNGFKQRGWQAVGVEPEAWCAEIARKRYGLEVISSPFQEAGLPKESFDAVLLLHVIEHVCDPLQALRDIRDLVRPGGYLVLETPRYDTLTFRLLRGRERSVIADHLHYFTRKSMLEMCRDAGFSADRVDAVGRTVTLDRLSFYLAKLSRSYRAARVINRLSDSMQLSNVRIHVNLHDMMRLYLKRN
jgi:2-polyprenyl-3-methyl-5-hydroxy-6-metoxy-1,4-benzoquinol methylase